MGSGRPRTSPPSTPETSSAVDQAAVETRAGAATVHLVVHRCGGSTVTGSGFLVDKRTIITNRHVIEGASRVEATTSTGVKLTVTEVERVSYVDLGIVTIAPVTITPLAPASADPPVATPITAVGYPLGGPLTLTHGFVAAYVNDPRLGNLDRVIQLNVEIAPGSSGGPLVDAQGLVVGVIYAVEIATQYSLGIPVMALAAARRDRSSIQPVPAC